MAVRISLVTVNREYKYLPSLPLHYWNFRSVFLYLRICIYARMVFKPETAPFSSKK